MTSQYSERGRTQIDAGRLWAGGVATAVVAALVSIVGILIARGLLQVAIFAPEGAGLWGSADTVTYAIAAGVVALGATGFLHFLLITTPRATAFFGWIMVLLTAIAVLIPLTVVSDKTEMIATTVLDLVIGLVITTLLINAADGARRHVRRPYRGQDARRQPYDTHQDTRYQTREW